MSELNEEFWKAVLEILQDLRPDEFEAHWKKIGDGSCLLTVHIETEEYRKRKADESSDIKDGSPGSL